MSNNENEVMQVAALLDENLNGSNNTNTTNIGTNGETSKEKVVDSKKRKTRSRSPSPKKSERKSSKKDKRSRSRERSKDRKSDKKSDKRSRSREKRDRSRDKKDSSRDKKSDRRSRSRDRHDRRSRDRYERRSREKRDRSRDKKSDRRSRSRDRYDRRSRDRYDRRSRDRYDRRSRDRYDRRSRDRHDRRSRDRHDRKSEDRDHYSIKEENQVERTQAYKEACTIFVNQLPILATAKEVVNYFSKVGTVRDVRLIPAEKGSRKSRGFGYVEFDTPEQASKAISDLATEKFQGRTLFLQSQLERLVTTTQKITPIRNNIMNNNNNNKESNAPVTKLYVGNFDETIEEKDLREALNSYGEIVSIDFSEDDKGKKQAYITYKDSSCAEEAYHSAKDKPIKGKTLKFGIANVPAKSGNNQTYHRNMSLVNSGDGKITTNIPHNFVHKPYNNQNNNHNQNQQQHGIEFNDTGLDKLDDDRGVALNARSRAILMSKLQRSEDFVSSKDNLVSPCIILKNVFDPSEEEGDNWKKEIEEDVAQECRKYGNVLRCVVEPTKEGVVYLRFETADFARNAIRDLNGRWFGKRQIVAEKFSLSDFTKKFSDK